ncbi:hypothetical protein A2U01_0063779, partial [Trifolium medium]|nr:hypothetical protein [Trifolium medium]
CKAVLKSKDSWRQAFLREDGEMHSGGRRGDGVNFVELPKIPMVAGCKIFKRVEGIPRDEEVRFKPGSL